MRTMRSDERPCHPLAIVGTSVARVGTMERAERESGVQYSILSINAQAVGRSHANRKGLATSLLRPHQGTANWVG